MAAIIGKKATSAKLTGIGVSVPDRSICKLSYYLNCVSTTLLVKQRILSKLTNYNEAHRLRRQDSDEIIQLCLAFHPAEVLNKLFVLDEHNNILPRGSANEFCEVQEVTKFFNVETGETTVGGEQATTTKIMMCTSSWINDHYFRPMRRLANQVAPLLGESLAETSSLLDQLENAVAAARLATRLADLKENGTFVASTDRLFGNNKGSKAELQTRLGSRDTNSRCCRRCRKNACRCCPVSESSECCGESTVCSSCFYKERGGLRVVSCEIPSPASARGGHDGSSRLASPTSSTASQDNGLSEGQTIRLVNTPDHNNGRRGFVTRIIPGDRYLVTLAETNEKRIYAAKYLEVQEEIDPDYPMGSLVELSGLASRAAKKENGKLGHVVGFPRKGRVMVQLLDDKAKQPRTISVKRENLVLIPEFD